MPAAQKQSWQYFEKLPKDVQEAIFAVETAKNIHQAAKKEGVLLQVSLLAEITGDVMLGILPLTHFTEAVQVGLGVNEKKARKITKTIDDKIFANIEDSLQKIHSGKPSSTTEKAKKPRKKKYEN